MAELLASNVTEADGDTFERKKNKVKEQESEYDYETDVFGDESIARGSHRCGGIHIPPITVKII